MNLEQGRVFDAFVQWRDKEEKRVSREWSEWDGTVLQGNAINDRQCDRIHQARERLGVTDAIIRTGYRIQ